MSITFEGNIAVIRDVNTAHLSKLIMALQLEQFSATIDNPHGSEKVPTYTVSFPMNDFIRGAFADQIRFANHQKKNEKGVDTKKGKPDNNGPKGPNQPSGGGPQGGGTPGQARQVTPINTYAVAA